MNRFSPLLTGLFFIICWTSCSKRPCKDLQCFNYGVLTYKDEFCYCDCPFSSTGEFCEIDLRDSLIAGFSLFDFCSSDTSIGSIQKNSGDRKYLINGLGTAYCSTPTSIQCQIDSNSVVIDSQSLCVDISGIYSLGIKGNAKVYYYDYHIEVIYYVFFPPMAGNRIDTCAVYMEKD